MDNIEIDGEDFSLDSVTDETKELVRQYFSGLNLIQLKRDELFLLEVGSLNLSHTLKERILIDTGKIQKQTRKINKFIRNTIKRKDITLQDYLLEIGYIRKHKSGKIITGDSLIAIHKIWRDKLKKKVKDLLINEKEFVVIIEKISIAVDGLKLELPLSEDALKRIRRKKRARNN